MVCVCVSVCVSVCMRVCVCRVSIGLCIQGLQCFVMLADVLSELRSFTPGMKKPEKDTTVAEHPSLILILTEERWDDILTKMKKDSWMGAPENAFKLRAYAGKFQCATVRARRLMSAGDFQGAQGKVSMSRMSLSGAQYVSEVKLRNLLKIKVPKGKQGGPENAQCTEHFLCSVRALLAHAEYLTTCFELQSFLQCKCSTPPRSAQCSCRPNMETEKLKKCTRAHTLPFVDSFLISKSYNIA